MHAKDMQSLIRKKKRHAESLNIQYCGMSKIIYNMDPLPAPSP